MSVLPFQWDPKSSRLEVGTKKQRIVMIIIIVYMYWEAFYQVQRLYHGYHNQSVSLTKYMKLVELFATRLTALLIQTITLAYCVDTKLFFNQLLSMNARFIEIYGHNHVRDPCTKIFALWYWFAMIHPTVTVAVYTMENKDDRYWHGALLPTAIQPFFVPLFILVEYWISVFSELGGVFAGCVMLSYYKATPVWMNELIIMVDQRKTNCEQVITLNRGMLILGRAFNKAYSLILAGGFFALMVDLTICLTVSLRVAPGLGLPGLEFPLASLTFVLVVEFTLRPTANLTRPSTDFLAAFSGVVSVKRCGTKRRGHVNNMEKERMKFMKIKRHHTVKTSGIPDSNIDDLEHRSSSNRVPKTSGSRWDEAILRIRVHRSLVASRLQAKRRCEGAIRASNDDDTEIICADEMGRGSEVSGEKKRFLVLRATAKSMYPMVVKCGTFFEFEHSSIYSFYSTVLDQTISALLLI